MAKQSKQNGRSLPLAIPLLVPVIYRPIGTVTLQPCRFPCVPLFYGWVPKAVTPSPPGSWTVLQPAGCLRRCVCGGSRDWTTSTESTGSQNHIQVRAD